MSNDFSNDDYNAMLQAMEKEEKENKGNLLYWNPKNEGEYPIRFISPLKTFNEIMFYQRHKIHYINKKPYFCLNQTLTDKNGVVHEAEECPICKKKNALYALSTGKESEEAKLASSISAKDRYVSRVVVRGLKDDKGNDIEGLLDLALIVAQRGLAAALYSGRPDVEAELGAVKTGAHSAEDSGSVELYTDPAQAAEFVRCTGIDALAVGWGYRTHAELAGYPIVDSVEELRRVLWKDSERLL